MPTWQDLAAAGKTGPILALTGAGISAESGIPTFRGPEGYWRVGSQNYRPEQLATWEAFERMPEAIWSWYLYRRAVCSAASPNVAHRALAEAAEARGAQFTLVTQNVDALHRRAGHPPQRLFEVHGNLDYVRCAAECAAGRRPFPAPPLPATGWGKDQPLDRDTAAALHCAACGTWLRPHVLWFDESYDEERFCYETALSAAQRCALLMVVGTSGATSLPTAIVHTAVARRVPVLVLNRDPSPYSELVEGARAGIFLPGLASEWVPRICAALT